MERNINDMTLAYYEMNAESFIKNSVNINFSILQNRFLSYLPQKASILDFGCGSGRDAKYFLSKGYSVSAIDGSQEMCRIAGTYTGIKVKNIPFHLFNEQNIYDGIWACASILHVSSHELPNILSLMRNALKFHGHIYISFKYGTFEGIRNQRYFTDMTETAFTRVLHDVDGLAIKECLRSKDVRKGREDEAWLNLFLQKI